MSKLPVKMIIAVVIMIGAFFTGYKAGNNACVANQVKAVEKADKQERVKVKEIIKWKERKKVVYRERIKYIKQAPKNECLDADLRDIGLDSMFKRNSGETKSGIIDTIGKTGIG
jgi:uncharacterized membrane protein YvbJ